MVTVSPEDILTPLFVIFRPVVPPPREPDLRIPHWFDRDDLTASPDQTQIAPQHRKQNIIATTGHIKFTHQVHTSYQSGEQCNSRYRFHQSTLRPLIRRFPVSGGRFQFYRPRHLPAQVLVGQLVSQTESQKTCPKSSIGQLPD